MLKKSTFFIFTLFLIMMLTGCSTDDFDIVYDVSSFDVIITAPSNYLSNTDKEYESIILSKNDNNTTSIKIPVQNFSLLDTYNSAKNDLKILLPQYSDIIDSIKIKSDIKYSGTTVFGTNYYSVTIGGIDAVIPVTIISSESLIFFENQASNTIEVMINASKNIDTELNFQTYESYISNLCIEVDFTTKSPFIKYSFFYDGQNKEKLERELFNIGLNVESINNNQVTCIERYTTCKDFESIFPVRLYSMFNILSTVSCSYKSSVVEKLDFTISFADIQYPFLFSINSNEKTKISTSDNEQVSHRVMEISEDITINANCNEIQWSKLATAMLSILAVSFVLAGMCVLAIRSNKKFDFKR